MDLFGRKKKKVELISALDGFIQQIYWGGNITAEQSQKSLEESLIELTKYKRHSSNGVLITDNGYFLTAQHCVEGDYLKDLEVRIDNTFYPVKKVCAISNKSDIALAKIDLPGQCKPKQYKLYDSTEIEKEYVIMMSKWNTKLVKKYGGIKQEEAIICIKKLDDSNSIIKWTNHFTTDCYSVPGDSGGIIVNPNGKLLGITSTGGDVKNLTSAINIIKALELVHFYKNSLQQSL